MADFREIPTATYDYEISKLVSYYEKALRSVNYELTRLDLSAIERANFLSVQANIKEILEELDDNASTWVNEYIPAAVNDGIVRAVIGLGAVDTVEEAQAIVSFNRLNRELVKAAVADTQDDLMQISQNIDRRVRTAIRQVTGEVLRSNLTQGINATATLRREIVRDLRKQLGDTLNTGIVDAANRRWKPQVYAEMVVKTKMAAAQREAAMNQSVSDGAYYAVISSHGATDACRGWEGRIIKLARNAPGEFPYISDLPRRDIFHPNCKHTITPLRRLEYLPDRLKRVNNL